MLPHCCLEETAEMSKIFYLCFFSVGKSDIVDGNNFSIMYYYSIVNILNILIC